MPGGPPAREALIRALGHLEELAREEYGATLNELLDDDEPVEGGGPASGGDLVGGGEWPHSGVRGSRDALWRIGRLVGITVKEPFARVSDIGDRPSQTGARRAWDLEPACLGRPRPEWWQYRLITGFLAVETRSDFDWLPPEGLPEEHRVAWFLNETHVERGVFRTVAVAARRHLGEASEVADVVEAVPWLGDGMEAVAAGLLLLATTTGLGRALPAPGYQIVET
ncbi:hypothetical protein [Sphaerisporangium aureirubrum]|uniref:Uncharacterized protein n=1 Tax=Sphaerisporangium aureirubrum TaxID=1544736 RepID=A0ABW1NS78_9ACTN